jgi:hypothetical protein
MSKNIIVTNRKELIPRADRYFQNVFLLLAVGLLEEGRTFGRIAWTGDCSIAELHKITARVHCTVQVCILH